MMYADFGMNSLQIEMRHGGDVFGSVYFAFLIMEWEAHNG